MKINMKLYSASKAFLAAGLVLTGLSVSAKENVGNIVPNNGPANKQTAATCATPTAFADLDINNVRARILAASDMWWDLVNAKYEIPKGSGKTSIFAGALWIGGIDQGGQIKVAGQTYRQTGNDFWTGPIDTANVTTTVAVCNSYDKHFTTTRDLVLRYIADPTSLTSTEVTTIKNWPAHGDAGLNQGEYLAPFSEPPGLGDGHYDPDFTTPGVGDYPGYNTTGVYSQLTSGYTKLVCNDYLFGDKNLWWVFNDVGNIHTETGSDPIGLEVRAQAFGFFTDDEINNMTFYKYQIINRGTTTLNDTYFGQWVDPDLGNAVDDYVGCDVKRGLGYVYNGDDDDDGATGYGTKPPSCGVDFFQGPLADVGDGLDNDKDGCVDCTYLVDSASGNSVPVSDAIIQEQIIMSKFVYYNNFNNTPDGNPNGFTDFYNYLSGIWLDGVPLTYGENGRNPGNPLCNYMFPDDTDSALNASNGPWTEQTAGNLPEDRRFLQSAGTFTLQPGAVNYVTTGVVWSQSNQLGVAPGIALMKQADDKAQALFDNCFKLIDGPDAPEMTIRELKNQLLFSLEKTDTTAVEGYHEPDPTIVAGYEFFDFQGYKIYQIKDPTVAVTDLDNPDKARLVQQFDLKDTVTTLINYTFDKNIGVNVPVLKVAGENKGIKHSFSVTTDLFASGSIGLVNNKTYFYMAVSYAYNEYKQYDPNDPNKLDGQKRPYLQGRNNVKVYSAIPHSITPEAGGTFLNSEFGDGPVIQRIDGQGNGGQVLELTAESINEILTSPEHRSKHPFYQPGRGPVNVQVFDPVLVTSGEYETRFTGVDPDSVWQMTNLTTQLMRRSDRPISDQYEQLLPEWGLSSDIHTVLEPGVAGADNNGLLEADMTFADNSMQWLTGVPDVDGPTVQNWIRSGTSAAAPIDYAGLDDGQVYENVIGGIWAPYRLTTAEPTGPKWNGSGLDLANKLNNIASIDLVITADKSKWSRCAVIETDDLGIGIGQAKKTDMRKSPSVDKNGVANYPSPDNNDHDSSMSWFPGYAINLETGERLNIAFGENSTFSGFNGTDMIWNPTSDLGDGFGNAAFGGMHYIYIFGHHADSPSDNPLYDGCEYIHHYLDSAAKSSLGIGNFLRRNVWKDAIWVSMPLTIDSKVKPKSGEMFIPPCDVKIRLRIAKNYKTYISKTIKTNPLQPNTEYYVVDGDITYDGQLLTVGTTFTTNGTVLNYTAVGAGAVVSPAPQNSFMPLYKFNTNGMTPQVNSASAASNALFEIGVVPNPYYAFSGYEGTTGLPGQVDNRIRITNLPSKCTISIFTTNGSLIRQFKRSEAPDNSRGGIGLDNPNTSQDWDLKNEKGITIASGIYLIHVEVPGVGERVIKWFGVLRPIDLDTF